MATKTRTTEPEHIGRVGQRLQVVIPRKLLETMRLREGDFIAFTRQQGSVLIRPKRLVDDDDVLTPEEARKVRKGLKQIRAGKTIPWSRIKHELDL
jgi:bifunctional DNA-binding transcriptional regulator/antitoxin component of YhaV-PrlF toxin-antitoxin module